VVRESLGLDVVNEAGVYPPEVVVAQVFAQDVVKPVFEEEGRVEVGDTFVSMDGTSVSSVQDIAIALLQVEGGVLLRFRRRDGAEYNARVELARMDVGDDASTITVEEEDPDDLRGVGDGMVWAAVGMTIRNGRRKGGKNEVVVVRVEGGGPAERGGLREGDVILQLNYGKGNNGKVRTVEDFRVAVETLAKRKPGANFEVPIQVKRVAAGKNVKFEQVRVTILFVRARFDDDNMRHVERLNQRLYQLVGFEFGASQSINPSYFIRRIEEARAELSRLRPGDVVVEVDGVSVANVPAREWVALLLGGADRSRVTMKVLSSAREVQVELTRRRSGAQSGVTPPSVFRTGADGLATLEFSSLGMALALREDGSLVVSAVVPQGVAEKLKIVRGSVLSEVDGVRVGGIAQPEDVHVLVGRPHATLKFRTSTPAAAINWFSQGSFSETKCVHQTRVSYSLTQVRVVMAKRLQLKLKALTASGAGFWTVVRGYFSELTKIDEERFEERVGVLVDVLQGQGNAGSCFGYVLSQVDWIRQEVRSKSKPVQPILELAAALQRLIERRTKSCVLAQLYLGLAMIE
jgi:C-terminal processing protease CtpA/Prc